MIEAKLDVTLVVADRPCLALEIAERAGVEALLFDRADYGGFSSDFERDNYSAALAGALLVRDIDLVAMAGFGTIFTRSFHAAFPGRVLNTPWTTVRFWLAGPSKCSRMTTRSHCTSELRRRNARCTRWWSVG